MASTSASVLEAARDRAREHAAAVAGAATAVHGQVTAGASVAVSQAAGHAATVATTVQGHVAAAAASETGQAAIASANMHYARAAELAGSAQGLARQRMQEVQVMIETFVKRKIKAQIEQLVEKLPGIAKDSMDDPDMPRVVARGKDRLVDMVWPDVREEILWEVAVALDGVEKVDLMPDGSGPDCVRAYLRYHLFPYNRSIWGMLRDPVWVIWKLISLIPIQGVVPILFAVLFLIIDKTDEFQLISFILLFKGTMFISMGIVRAIVGFFLYVNCVSVPGREDYHFCDMAGPGSAGDFYLPAAGFLLQLVLVWLAFCLLPCSSEKGKAALKDEELHKQAGIAAKKGGYIRYFLYYDLVCFAICLGAIGYVISLNLDDLTHWPVRHALWAIQIVYGFLNMPFFIFTLPFVQTILTHAVPTAYDEKGRCRKFAKPVPVTKQEEKKEKANLWDNMQFISEQEMNEILDKAKAAFINLPGGIAASS